jgi:hypothetical protein
MTTGRISRKKTEYVVLKVMRPLTYDESVHINLIEDANTRKWEIERYTLLFEIAVHASSNKDAVRMLRRMLSSKSLIVEVRNGSRKRDVKEIPPTKPKGRRV